MTDLQTRDRPAPGAAPPAVVLLDAYVAERPSVGNSAEARAINEGTRSVDYVCSTTTQDGHGTVVAQNWRLDRYAKNPVVLFCHDSRSIPVGTASNVRVENGALKATVTFATADLSEDADECYRAVKAGLLRGISVGFKPHAYRWEMKNDEEFLVLDDNELLELSVCPVPSNPDALAQRSLSDAALSHHRARAEALRQPKPSQEPTMDLTKQVDDLRALVSSKDGELATLRASAATLTNDLTAARAAADKAAAELAARDATVATLTAEAERLGASVATLTERATKAESSVVRMEIESRVGRDVDPSEVEHLAKLRAVSPELYDAEMKRRAVAGRDDKLTKQVIAADAPDQRDGAAVPNPFAAFERALALSSKE